MIEFKSMGHRADAHGWRLTVVNGKAELMSDGNGAYNGVEDLWSETYTARQLRDLAEMFAAAAALLEPAAPVGKLFVDPLTLEQLIGLPEGSVVLDGEGDEWIKRSDGMWQRPGWPLNLKGETSKHIMQWGDVRCA